jgi:hypothetical protein
LAPLLGVLLVVVAGCSTPETTPRPTPTATADALSLETLDAEVTIEAVDDQGVWGTISLRRGSDTGGYPTNTVGPDSFVIEVWVQYEPTRTTLLTFGADDWALATADDRRPIGRGFIPDPPVDRPFDDWDLDPLLRGFTTENATTDPLVISGWLYFEVPREAMDEALALIYRPEGFVEAVAAVPVREPADAPELVPAATPDPTPAPLVYETPAGAAFTVIADDRADDLFVEPDTCTNPVAGYTVSYPDTWYTNTDVGDTPACSWFSPTFYEVDGSGVPDEVAIVIRTFEGGVGFVHEPVYTLSEVVTVDGWRGGRAEELGGFGAEGYLPPSLFTYEYRVFADVDEFGLKVFAATSNEMGGDYELNKAILDRIMLSMRFDR